MASLDPQIDALYQKPLDEFTSARNALAKTLTGADRERVRALPKPTVVPWAINQLYWRARGAFDRLRASGEKLRAAQIAALKGKSADIRGASDAQRKAISDAVQQATAFAGESGSRPNPDELTRTLEALSVAPELPEAPGRLTRPLQPAGFEALAGVKPAAVRPEPAHAAPREIRERDRGSSVRLQPAVRDIQAERQRLEAERRAELALRGAEAALDRARAAETAARAAWERAKDQTQAAERAVADARRALKR